LSLAMLDGAHSSAWITAIVLSLLLNGVAQN